jgi:hypothetical protein
VKTNDLARLRLFQPSGQLGPASLARDNSKLVSQGVGALDEWGEVFAKVEMRLYICRKK